MLILNHQAHQDHQEVEIHEPSGDIDLVARQIVDSTFVVHKEIGPGLLESAYELFLMEELSSRGLKVSGQVPISVSYRTKIAETAYKIDLLVENSVIIELKACERLLPIHQAQILTYMRFSKMKLGFLINFNVPLIKEGIRRFAL